MSEIALSKFQILKRVDSEFFLKKYLINQSVIEQYRCFELQDIANFITNGHTPYGTDLSKGEIKFVTAEFVKDFFITDVSKYISEEDHDNYLKRSQLENGDIILTIKGKVGNAVPIFNLNEAININQDVARLQIKNSFNIFYLSAFINSKYGKLQTEKESTGQINPFLSLGNLKYLKIPLLFSNLDEHIEIIIKKAYFKLEQSKSLYSEAETLLLQELGLENWQPPKETIAVKSFAESFGKAGRLDAEYYQPKYDEIINIAGKNAKYCKKIAELQVLNARGLQPNYIENGELSVINSRHILEQQLDYGNFEKTNTSYWINQERARVFKNDILTYTTGANIGRTNVYLIEEKAMASNHVNILRIKNENPVYVGFVLNSLIGRLQTEKLCTGSAQQELYPKDLEQFIIPFIDKVVQERIVNKVQENLSLKTKSQQLLDLAKKAVETAIEQGEDEAMKFIAQGLKGEIE